ncbi:prenylcysteine oxidase-like [Pollicipes pollicipes]|uniref:prenylcysteine oxidase-like n=1 Tax=Pollicipes pollicipes TaxID=41117 RepID=UPI001884C6D8|nr:prenylcysteine oxidase-like [Pollicipes pollicipes]
MDFIDKFGLQRRPDSDDTFGLCDGQQLLFVSSSWSFVTMAKLFWRYGYDVIKLQRLVSAMLLKFSSIYNLLDSGAAYDTVEDLIMAMDPSLIKLMGLPLSQYLKLSGLQPGFVDEMVTAATLTNYGQRPDIHAFVGMVALAGAGNELTAVMGGNYQVAVKAVEESGATVRKERVEKIKFTGDAYLVTSADGGGAPQTQVFDIVIVAAPQTADHAPIVWEGLPAPLHFPGRYHNLSVTFVDGELRPGALAASSLPEDILCSAGCAEFNSIGRVRPVSGAQAPHAVHKVFSNAPLSAPQLDALFAARRRERRLSWLAYPSYGVGAPLGNFTLRDNLYYLNSVEAAASAMEMSVVAARNVANMAYARWYNRPPPDMRRFEHTEL